MKSILETWRPVVGYEGVYEVSDSGCVRSRNGGKVRYLKGSYNDNGYVIAELWNNGKRKKYRVHRLVYEAFRGTIPDGMQIDHINTVRNDNRLCNLRCVTPRENCNNPITAERMQEAVRRRSENTQWREKLREARRARRKTKKYHRAREKPIIQLDSHTGKFVVRWVYEE